MEEKRALVIFTYYCPWCAKTVYATTGDFVINGTHTSNIHCPGGCGHEFEYDITVKTDPLAASLYFQGKLKTYCVFDKFAYRLKDDSVSLLMANVKRNEPVPTTGLDEPAFELGYRWMHGSIACGVFSLYRISPEWKKTDLPHEFLCGTYIFQTPPMPNPTPFEDKVKLFLKSQTIWVSFDNEETNFITRALEYNKLNPR
ncbi:MAG: hypothetical protein PHN44_00540 [Candidatus Marinimicrobia bacterium]|nr:hypothetical protein [Candidatus Neomarinimicrobiota bacterium]MDD5539147.1 hypothetical protein [Candidatus Neomarinimicrobiota bacterium]